MSAELIYFSPTTPGAASFTEDITSAIRLGEISGLAADARLGATATSGQILDDPNSDLGHAGELVGLKQAYLNETLAPAGNQRVWTGYTGDRGYRRGTEVRPSLRLGVAREVDMTLVEMNNFLDFRVFAPTADDPTSDFVRPDETDLERVAALLTTVDFLSTTLFDIGYIPATGGVAMDAHDYTGETAAEVLNDCAQVSGRNFFVIYDETGNQYVLWYDNWTTDGSTTLVYDSTLKLTNVNSELDSVTFAIAPYATETRDPSRVVSAVWVMGDGLNVYRTRPTTAYTFGWRDAVMEATYLSDPVKLAALGDRYLDDNSTEDVKITCSVQLPAALVTGIKKGQRIQLHATHLPSVASGFTWCRILSLTVRQDKETTEYYWLDLELSPIPEPCVTDPTFIFECASGLADLYAMEISGVWLTPTYVLSETHQFATLPPADPALSALTVPSVSEALIVAGYIMGNDTDSDGPKAPDPNYTSVDLDIDHDRLLGDGCDAGGVFVPEVVVGHKILTSPSAGTYGAGLVYDPTDGHCTPGGGIPNTGGVWWGGTGMVFVTNGSPISIVQTKLLHKIEGSEAAFSLQMDSPLTGGNVLVVWLAQRTGAGSITPPVDWTETDEVQCSGRLAEMMYHTVECE